jgi:hypothetical protein
MKTLDGGICLVLKSYLNSNWFIGARQRLRTPCLLANGRLDPQRHIARHLRLHLHLVELASNFIDRHHGINRNAAFDSLPGCGGDIRHTA